MGSLTFTPVPYATGASIITVTVCNGAANNNLVSRTFTVSVRYYNGTTRRTDQITAPTLNQQWTNVNISGNTSPINSNTVNLAVPPAESATLGSTAYGNGRYAFVVSGASGYKYMVQASTDLVNWVSIQTNTAPFTFVDTNAGQFSQRFYRSVSNP
jgi:hypothetical protein